MLSLASATMSFAPAMQPLATASRAAVVKMEVRLARLLERSRSSSNAELMLDALHDTTIHYSRDRICGRRDCYVQSCLKS